MQARASSTAEILGSSTAEIDPRGPQLNAILTSVVLALSLLTAPAAVGVALLGLQAVLFAVAVALGVQRTPAAFLFRRLVRPRLSAPTHLEDPRPPRFAQGVGLFVSVVGLVLQLFGVPWALPIAAALAFVAAFLNAAFGLCLGCQLYLLLQRVGLVGRERPAAA